MVRKAVARSSRAPFRQQAAGGFWCGELTAHTTLESDYILLQLWLHQPEGAVECGVARCVERACRTILERQLPDGRFNIDQLCGECPASHAAGDGTGALDARKAIAKAVRGLRSIQNPDGGWGESCAGDARERFVPAPSCASQTAWDPNSPDGCTTLPRRDRIPQCTPRIESDS